MTKRFLPIAGITTAISLWPRSAVYAEESLPGSVHELVGPKWSIPSSTANDNDQRMRKPIYDSPASSAPYSHTISATTPAPASRVIETPVENDRKSEKDAVPTPTDRLASQIKRTRLFLHSYAATSEDALNRGMDRVMDAEHSFTGTVASLAPPREANEKLLPGTIYVLVAAMAGSIVSRNRNVLIRFVTPVVAGVTTAHYVVPRTTENVGNLIWRYEQKFPVIRDNHLQISERVRHFVDTGKAHSKTSLAMAQEKVSDARQAVEDWVKKGQ